MEKLTLSVHEFMSIMGSFDEQAEKRPQNSVYNHWLEQYRVLDERLEALEMMERADMLFDGKVNLEIISKDHLAEVISSIKEKIDFQKGLISGEDEDADPEDLVMWESRLKELVGVKDRLEL